MLIPGISKEEMEAAKKVALDDIKKENDSDKPKNRKSGRSSKKTSKSK